jgi:hypothetical protein
MIEGAAVACGLGGLLVGLLAATRLPRGGQSSGESPSTVRHLRALISEQAEQHRELMRSFATDFGTQNEMLRRRLADAEQVQERCYQIIHAQNARLLQLDSSAVSESPPVRPSPPNGADHDQALSDYLTPIPDDGVEGAPDAIRTRHLP